MKHIRNISIAILLLIFNKIIAQAPAFSNTPASPGNQIMFNTCKASTASPRFAVVPAAAANRIMIELNTNSGFTGTAYTQTFSAAYASGTKYDLYCDLISLPQGTYFCRARTSNNAGSTWTAYSTALWVYTFSSIAPWGHHHTAKEQFDSPNSTLVTPSPLYGNFITTNNNGTANNATDDYFLLNQGSVSSLSCTTADGVKENGSWYPSVNYMTLGWQDDCNGDAAIYNGLPFILPIPNAATILTSSISLMATNTCFCETQNSQQYLKIRAHNVDNAANPGATINTLPRTTAGIDWDFNTTWVAGTRYSSPDVSSVVQEIVNRAGWAASNQIDVLIDWDSGSPSGTGNNRCVNQRDNGTATSPQIDATFNNFYNELTSPTFSLNSVVGATSWDQCYFTNDLTGCGTCSITYSVYTSANVLIASGSSSPFSLGGNTAASVYVKARIFRSNTGTFTPKGLDFTLTTNSAILPVELINFDAICSNNEVMLNWCTSSEHSNSYFTIEQSSNGTDFYTLGTIKGSGTSSNKNCYSYKTTQMSNEFNYYKLNQTDITSKTSVSKVIVVKGCDVPNSTILVTNSGKKEVNIIMNSTSNQTLKLKIQNLLGQLVDERELFLVEGNNTINISMPNLSNGMYNVLIEKEGQLFTNKKIIVSDN